MQIRLRRETHSEHLRVKRKGIGAGEGAHDHGLAIAEEHQSPLLRGHAHHDAHILDVTVEIGVETRFVEAKPL